MNNNCSHIINIGGFMLWFTVVCFIIGVLDIVSLHVLYCYTHGKQKVHYIYMDMMILFAT